ncbi:MAG TPA: 50S ribosomal protein L18e [Thermoplasmata archaeon]|nr:50S ribosomal protein L18e [Thermoplasmata archaeon]
MAPPIRKENSELVRVVVELRKAARAHQAPIWARAAERLERARHQTTPVNVGHLERLVAADATVVVPGKLLADGRLTKAITVAAFSFSAGARQKIRAAGGSALSIPDLLQNRPDGAGVRLFA